MIALRGIRRCVLALVAVGVVAGVGCVPAAVAVEAGGPWWGLTTGARPTNLAASSGTDDVQSLRVSATKGDYLMVVGERITPVAFDASAAVVRETLEAGLAPGMAAPTVTEVPSGEEDTRVFEIVYPSAKAEPPLVVPDTEEYAKFFGGEPLEGGKTEAVAAQVQQGTPSENEIVVWAENLGNAPTSGPVTITDQLPAGLVATGVSARAGGASRLEEGPVACEITSVSCTFERNFAGEPGVLPPFEVIEMRIKVKVTANAAAGESNTATVAGGGAPSETTAGHLIALGSPQRFGVEEYSMTPEDRGGSIDTQAGSHPFQLTTNVLLNNQTSDAEGYPRSVALPKDVITELPPGLVGNTTAFAQCTDAQFAEVVFVENETLNACPADSAVGVVNVSFNAPATHLDTVPVPVFNMVPRPGEPVRFGFKVAGFVSVFLDTSVRTGADYGVNVSSLNIIQADWLLGVRLTVWGVPGAREHDGQRGWNCLLRLGGASGCPAVESNDPPPFLAMPTSCGAPFESTVRADSWGASGSPAQTAEPVTYKLPEGIDGCNHLPFAPSIRVTPDGVAASTPTGLNVDVHVPQDSVLKAESPAEAAVKDISVTLPDGVAVDPSGANGLLACSEGQVGFTGFAALGGEQAATFTPVLPEPLQPGVNFCPDGAKVGTVRIKIPIIANPLEGSVYLAAQNENPFGSLIGLYIIARDPVSGVLVKLPGEVHLSETGQLTGTFHDSPQAPFEDAELHFFGGERAPLATPAHCGTYTTSASLTPWSGGAPVSSTSSFQITSGPNGTPCPGAQLPFSPTLTAGTTNIQAGAYSVLTTTAGRQDGNQDLAAVQLRMPPGLSGNLTGVALCPEAQANAGTCGPGSLIGETIVSAGLGSDPVSVTGGRVYLTEHYRGAPFGLSIVNPVKAGPFDLENTPASHPACDCVVVRAKVEVDPLTAQLQVTTDPAGPYAIPHLIEGVPVQIKHVNVQITRPNFTFNPTSCDPSQITGSIQSDEGSSQPVAVPFQVTNCAALKFAPKFSATTSGKPSRINGTALTVNLAYPKAPWGTQANVHSVKVELPKSLPSRLSTLQKACAAHTFETNPASCPAASVVGHAVVHTPILPVPLEGPAYFVSHGGEAFPSLIIALQGYGVSVNLVGQTLIKNGITSSTFNSTPDVPFETFQLTLPQGPYSALAAIGNPCKESLLMPTSFVAQNGATLKQATHIQATGCTNTLTILHKTLHNGTLTLRVSVPTAGNLKAHATGLSGASKTTSGRETITLTLHVLTRRKGHHTTHLQLTFKPTAGHTLHKNLKLKT